MLYRLDDLPAAELEAALSVDANELPEAEVLAIKDFIERIGGRENATMAVELLLKVERYR